MTEQISEAAKPRPLREHMARAKACWDKLADFAQRHAGDPNPALIRAQLDALRQAASVGYWLYPLVEARRGIPR